MPFLFPFYFHTLYLTMNNTSESTGKKIFISRVADIVPNKHPAILTGKTDQSPKTPSGRKLVQGLYLCFKFHMVSSPYLHLQLVFFKVVCHLL